MAMTLRLSRADEIALEALAKAEGTSKHEAALRAIREAAMRVGHETKVVGLSASARARYAELLEIPR